jgi:hypothetical protein
MKTLHSLPKDKRFFDNYATLIKSVVLAGIFAQVVSGMTESGAIFTSTKQSLEPFQLGLWGLLLAALVALLATAVIEVGLRKTFPVAVDAVLYNRWSGLELWISVFVWLLSVVLFGASGLLSFHNSKVIVDDFTPPPVEQTTMATDSTYQSETSTHRATFATDSTIIADAYAAKIASTTTAYDGKIKAKTEKIRGYESREGRTGKSYVSSKDRVRQQRAELEAEKATELATLTAAKADELKQARANYRAMTETATADRKTAAAEIKAANDKAEADRIAAVNKYGGGLGWFTVVCLFLFAVSVVLDRIHRKGAGIEESVQIEAYDFRPGAFREWWSAISERISYKLHNRITAFANGTPSAPLPAQPGAVYDLAEALQHVTIKLQLEQADEDEQRIVYLNAKEPEESTPAQRRQIGFQQQRDAENSCDLYSTRNTNDAHTKHEHETVDLREAKQRLKMYKKRLGSHQQKALKQEENKGKVCKRTADAITNNKGWISHYEQVINQLQTSNI